MPVSQFMSIDGYEVVQDARPCGCLSETTYDSEGIVHLMRVQMCGTCWDSAFQYLDELRKGTSAQQELTLDLPSPRVTADDHSSKD